MQQPPSIIKSHTYKEILYYIAKIICADMVNIIINGRIDGRVGVKKTKVESFYMVW